MAIGDDAQAAGMDLVPQNGAVGSPGKVKQGWQEFNRTRDYIAQFFIAAKTYALGLVNALGSAAQYEANTSAVANTVILRNVNGHSAVPTPTNSAHIANRGYVDSALGTIDLSSRVAKAGDTMWGHLYLPNAVAADAGYTVAYINGDGRVARGASGEQFKDDITAIDPASLGDLFPQLYEFIMRDDPGRMQRIGWIAQRLEESDDLRRFVVYAREAVYEDVTEPILEDVLEDVTDDEGTVIDQEVTGQRVVGEKVVDRRVIGHHLTRDEDGNPIPESIDFIALLIAQNAQLHDRLRKLEEST